MSPDHLDKLPARHKAQWAPKLLRGPRAGAGLMPWGWVGGGEISLLSCLVQLGPCTLLPPGEQPWGKAGDRAASLLCAEDLASLAASLCCRRVWGEQGVQGGQGQGRRGIHGRLSIILGLGSCSQPPPLGLHWSSVKSISITPWHGAQVSPSTQGPRQLHGDPAGFRLGLVCSQSWCRVEPARLLAHMDPGPCNKNPKHAGPGLISGASSQRLVAWSQGPAQGTLPAKKGLGFWNHWPWEIGGCHGESSC